MKRRLFSILALLLVVGVVAVTTPCDCKAVSEAINSVSPAQHETCPFCAKHNKPVVKPILDQRAVLANPVLHVPVSLVPVAFNAVHFEQKLSLVTVHTSVQYSPPVSPPSVLRI